MEACGVKKGSFTKRGVQAGWQEDDLDTSNLYLDHLRYTLHYSWCITPLIVSQPCIVIREGCETKGEVSASHLWTVIQWPKISFSAPR